jgi:hypothetical protein
MGRVAAASGAAEDLHDYLAILSQLEEAHAGASVVVLHACGLLSPARAGTSPLLSLSLSTTNSGVATARS